MQNLVSIIPWTFIAQLCNLFIQLYLIKRFLLKPINAVLEHRKEMATAEMIKAEYEQNMAEAKEKANALITNAQKSAALQSEEVIQEANRQAAAIKAKAESDIEQEKKKAVNELKGEIGGMAMEIAGKVIEREISEKDHEKLIDEFISNVGEAS